MKISTKGRYALRVMLDIATHPDGGPTSLAGVAERQEISLKYLESIVAALSKAGLLKSFRGKTGGYILGRAPEQITVLEILEAAEGSLAPVGCVENGCPRLSVCGTVALWKKLDSVICDYLGGVTLKDVADGKL